MNYQKVFDDIRQIINKHDPVGLVAGGAPDDEYDREVAEIVRLFTNDLKKGELIKALRKIFADAFSEEMAGNIEKYELIIDEIKKMDS